METDPHPALDAWLRRVDDLLAEDAGVPHQPRLSEEDHQQPDVIGKLWAKLHKERDLELHLRAGWLFGTEFVQLVDYQPSTGRYENAVMVDRRLLGRLLEKLLRLQHYSGGASR